MKTGKIFPLVAILALAGTSVAACGGDDAQSDLDRDLELAMAEDSLAELSDTASALADEPEPRAEPPARQPAQQPRPQTPRPRQQNPQPAPEQPAPDPGPQYQDLTVAGGTSIGVTLNQELSTRTNAVGDLFTTTVSSPVMVGGEIAIPAGSQIRGRVTAVQKSGNSGEAAVLKVEFDEVSIAGDTYPIQLSVAEATPTSKRRSSTGEDVGKVGIGAIAGAVIGQVVGGNSKGALIGAAVGAAAGTAIVLSQGDADAVLAEGSAMTLTLDAPLTVRAEV